MIIKVCGMKDAGNITDLSELDIDYIGFIFYPLSPRFVGNPDPDMLSLMPGRIKKTGVFVNEEADRVVDVVMRYTLSAVQLHGEETPEYCNMLRKMLHNFNTERPVEIIKAFGIHPGFDFNSLSVYEDFVDYFLFDTSSAEYGGSGQTFDWELLKNYNGLKPYFLSGGLGAAQVNDLRNLSHPGLLGYDLNSKFEISPGFKDIDLLRRSIDLLRGSKQK